MLSHPSPLALPPPQTGEMTYECRFQVGEEEEEGKRCRVKVEGGKLSVSRTTKKSYGKERGGGREPYGGGLETCANLAGKCFLKGWLWAVFWFWAVEFFFLLPSSFFLEVGAYSWRRRRGPLVFILLFQGLPERCKHKSDCSKREMQKPRQRSSLFSAAPYLFFPRR